MAKWQTEKKKKTCVGSRLLETRGPETYMQKVLELEDPCLAGSASSRNELDPPAPLAPCPHPIPGERLWRGGGVTTMHQIREAAIKHARLGFACK